MPWQETDAMKERVKFVLEWERRWNEGEGCLNHPEVALPAPNTMGEILHRRGMTLPQVRRVRATKASTQPFADVKGPNAVWCVDECAQLAPAPGR